MLAGPAFAAVGAVVPIGGMHAAFHDRGAIGLAVVDVEGRHLRHGATRQGDRLAHRHLLARRQDGIGIHRIFAGEQVFELIAAVGTGLHIVAEVVLVAIDDEDVGLGRHHGVGRQGIVIVGMMHQHHRALHRARAALARAFVARGHDQSQRKECYQKSCHSVHYVKVLRMQKYLF